MANICWRRFATATAATLPFTCATARDNGPKSPISTTASSTWNSATTAGCMRRRSRTLRSAASSRFRSPIHRWPRRASSFQRATSAPKTVIPTRTRLYVRYRDGGPSVVRVFTLDGKRLPDLPAEPLSEISLGERLGGDDVLVRTMSYRSPPSWFRYDAARNRLRGNQAERQAQGRLRRYRRRSANSPSRRTARKSRSTSSIARESGSMAAIPCC